MSHNPLVQVGEFPTMSPLEFTLLIARDLIVRAVHHAEGDLETIDRLSEITTIIDAIDHNNV